MAIETISTNNPFYERIAIGDTVIQDIATLQVLVASIASNSYATFRLQGETSGYTPGTNKRFRVIALHRTNIGGGAETGAGIGTGTNDVGYNSASEPTSPDYSQPRNLPILNSGTLANLGYAFIIPAERYAYYYTTQSGACWLLGYEE